MEKQSSYEANGLCFGPSSTQVSLILLLPYIGQQRGRERDRKKIFLFFFSFFWPEIERQIELHLVRPTNGFKLCTFDTFILWP